MTCLQTMAMSRYEPLLEEGEIQGNGRHRLFRRHRKQRNVSGKLVHLEPPHCKQSHGSVTGIVSLNRSIGVQS